MKSPFTYHRLTLLLVAVSLSVSTARAQRLYGGFYTKEKLQNVRNNCEKFEWAKQRREQAVKNAQLFVSKSDEELWSMVPGQNTPRCIDVTFDRLTKGPKILGCLKCGDNIFKHGNYPYTPDFENKPWKLTCPSCKSVFPTNDFAKFYQSALDERGEFDVSRGDRSLLFNADHPDPGDPLHKFGVDDGFGYIDENGRSHKYIGYYQWKHWDYITQIMETLSDAFVYTGNDIYARKTAIILDRIADVYPAMDWKPYADRGWYGSDGGSNLGKIGGSIWETGYARSFADSYDKIISGTVENAALYDFLKERSEKYRLNKKGTREAFINNVDEGILRTVYKAVLSKQIRGNQGMHQLALINCALALDTQPETTEWLDWVFASKGGNIAGQMINNFDHDGTTEEGAPGYTLFWGRLATEMIEKLNGYTGYTKHDIVKEFPQLGNTYLAAYRMSALGYAIPNIGDSGSTGYIATSADPKFIAKGYAFFKRPEFAQAAFLLNKRSAEGLARDIFSANPESISKEIQELGQRAGTRPEGGYLMSGFGLALLENGIGKNGVALAANYGRTSAHAHPDMLNFDLLAFDNWLTPDHGYPEFATAIPSNREWTGSTVSHNTVFVDQEPQKEIWSGTSKIFRQLKGFGIFELDGQKAYPQTDTYARTMFLIGTADEKNSYVVDIFRVKGGRDHLFSFHGPPGTSTVTGLNLKALPGTYAGDTIKKGTAANKFPKGYSFFYNVRKDEAPPKQFTIDWTAEPGYRNVKPGDDVHLKLHALSPANDVALADGDPPQNKPGNPEKLGYVLMHRQGDNLSSSFISVLEPYKKAPFIQSVRRVPAGNEDHIAIEVKLVDGTTDHIFYNADGGPMSADGIALDGTAGYIRSANSKAQRSVLINGTQLSGKGSRVSSGGALKGKIVKMNRSTSGGGWLLVDTALPTDGSLNGQQLFIETDSERDASYTIAGVTREGNYTRVDCGSISFVRAVNPESAGGGTNPYLYDFEEGSDFNITRHEEWNINK